MILNYKYRIYTDFNVMDEHIFVFNQAYNASLNLIQKEGRYMYNNGLKSTKIFNILYLKLKSILGKRNITNSALIQDALRSAYNTLFTNIKQNKSFTLHFKDSSSLEGSFPFRTKKIPTKVFKTPIKIKLHRDIPSGYRIMGSKIKRENDCYYIILTITDDKPDPMKPKLTETNTVGIDANQGNYVFSDNYKLEFLKIIYPDLEQKRIFRQKKLSSKKKGSNRRKARKNLFNVSRKIKRRRTDDIHKRVNTVLKRNYQFYIIEKLNIKNMTKKESNTKNTNKNMVKNMLHISHNQFFSVFAYKALLMNRFVLKVNPAYTSMTCSRCGSVKKMELFNRTYQCESCGLNIDRDLNAAINIKRLGLSLYS